MSTLITPKLTAALIYKRCDPLNFKHLATTLNLILEPAKIRFRVIHERPGSAAVLSCRKLHISLKAQPAERTPLFLKDALTSEHLSDQLLARIQPHERTVEISMGTGPLPHSSAEDDTSAANLLPLLGQMVVNHLLNMNPAEAVYWGGTNSLMTPRAFLELINAPVETPQDKTPFVGPKPPPRPRRVAKDTGTKHHGVIAKRQKEAADRAPASTRLLPNMINAHLIDGEPEQQFELTDHIRQRFNAAMGGPKAAFIVSMATMLVAPLIGVLLLIYNFMGGARLRQTALLACLTALVTLTAELVTNSDANATIEAPVEQTAP